MKARFATSNTMLTCRAQTLMRLCQKFLLLVSLAPAATGYAQVPSAAARESWPDWMVRLLEVRKTEQFQLAKEFKAFYGFQFTNEIERSGINFEHHIVDDCGRDLKAIITITARVWPRRMSMATARSIFTSSTRLAAANFGEISATESLRTSRRPQEWDWTTKFVSPRPLPIWITMAIPTCS